MTDETDPFLWSVDRSWSYVAQNLDGQPYYQTKVHLDDGDTRARCSRQILLNSLPGDRPSGRLSDYEGDPRLVRWICRRCVPRPRS